MKRPFLEIGVPECSLCIGCQSHDYWLWMEMALEMPTHITCLSTGSISETEDWLIYSSVSFPALSRPHAPIIIMDIIISSFPFNLLLSLLLNMCSMSFSTLLFGSFQLFYPTFSINSLSLTPIISLFCLTFSKSMTKTVMAKTTL